MRKLIGSYTIHICSKVHVRTARPIYEPSSAEMWTLPFFADRRQCCFQIRLRKSTGISGASFSAYVRWHSSRSVNYQIVTRCCLLLAIFAWGRNVRDLCVQLSLYAVYKLDERFILGWLTSPRASRNWNEEYSVTKQHDIVIYDRSVLVVPIYPDRIISYPHHRVPKHLYDNVRYLEQRENDLRADADS